MRMILISIFCIDYESISKTFPSRLNFEKMKKRKEKNQKWRICFVLISTYPMLSSIMSLIFSCFAAVVLWARLANFPARTSLKRSSLWKPLGTRGEVEIGVAGARWGSMFVLTSAPSPVTLPSPLQPLLSIFSFFTLVPQNPPPDPILRASWLSALISLSPPPHLHHTIPLKKEANFLNLPYYPLPRNQLELMQHHNLLPVAQSAHCSRERIRWSAKSPKRHFLFSFRIQVFKFPPPLFKKSKKKKRTVMSLSLAHLYCTTRVPLLTEEMFLEQLTPLTIVEFVHPQT